jgi:hypothetical protein
VGPDGRQKFSSEITVVSDETIFNAAISKTAQCCKLLSEIFSGFIPSN